jgi:outer membrane lipoprotein SlyB
MEKSNSRLHPLLTAAAISVTVFSAVGVATLTGLIPPSVGSAPEAPPALETPAPKVAEAPIPVEAPKPAKPKAVRKAAAKPAPAAYPEYQPEQEYQPAPQVVEAPKPAAPIGVLATVEDVREVTTPGEHTALGPIAGGVAGAVLGHQIGGGSGKKIATVLGALGGAVAGRHIEKQARGEKHWETVVRLEDGTQRTVQSTIQPFWRAGDRVRFFNGGLQPA